MDDKMTEEQDRFSGPCTLKADFTDSSMVALQIRPHMKDTVLLHCRPMLNLHNTLSSYYFQRILFVCLC